MSIYNSWGLLAGTDSYDRVENTKQPKKSPPPKDKDPYSFSIRNEFGGQTRYKPRDDGLDKAFVRAFGKDRFNVNVMNYFYYECERHKIPSFDSQSMVPDINRAIEETVRQLNLARIGKGAFVRKYATGKNCSTGDEYIDSEFHNPFLK